MSSRSRVGARRASTFARAFATAAAFSTTATTRAHADGSGAAAASPAATSPQLAAIAAPADDAFAAIAIGPSGEVYAPDHHGRWIRSAAGGIAGAVTSVVVLDGELFAGIEDGPPFHFADGAWASIHLALHGKAIVGRGTRAIAVLGRDVYRLGHGAPQKLPEAPAKALAAGATSTGTAIATARGVFRLDGNAWRAIARAPASPLALAGDRFAITGEGTVDLRTGVATAWGDGEHATAWSADGDRLYGAAATADGIDLIAIRAGTATKVHVPMPSPAEPVGVAVDGKRAVIALRDGRLAIRDGERGDWKLARVEVALAPARPGPAAAHSR